jgi:hypothetical protein
MPATAQDVSARTAGSDTIVVRGTTLRGTSAREMAANQKPLTQAGSSSAAQVLWWDATPEYGGQAPDSYREEMADYLTNFNGGGVFDATFVASQTPGALAAHLATNSYDVIVFDTTGPNTFDAADVMAVQDHYMSHSNVLLDGILYIRNINLNTTTDFPGINGSTGGFTANEVSQIAQRGGGIMIGTDHNCCQWGANTILGAIIPGAGFSGLTTPSLDGQFNGTQLLDDVAMVSAFDLFSHWAAVPSQAETPVGMFTDITGAMVELWAQVEVADFVGGPLRPYISTSWEPGTGGPQFDCNNNGILDSIDIANGTSQDRNLNTIPDECEEISAGYCSPALANSTGNPGGIFAGGSVAAADESLQLYAYDLPPGERGLFITSPNQGMVVNPGAHMGTLCVVPSSIARFVPYMFTADANGIGSMDLDPWIVNALPDRPILSGETWHYQCWYTDGQSSNFTDACSISFN